MPKFTLQQFRKIQKFISVLINKIEKEAIDNGEDISTSEFQDALLKIKEKILEEKGMTLDEYEKLRKGFKDVGFTSIKQAQEEFQNIMDLKLYKKEMNELSGMKGMFEGTRDEVEKIKGAIISKKGILDIVKPLIPKVPEPNDFDHPGIIKEIDGLNKKIRELNERLSSDIYNVEAKIPTEFKHALEEHQNSKLMKDLETLTDGSNADKLHTHKLGEKIIRPFFGGGGIDETHIRDMIDSKIAGVSGSTLSVELLAPNGVLTIFVVANEPVFVVADGQAMYDGYGYTYAAGSITMENPPQSMLISFYNS
jgi:hypothetical protein